MSSGRRDPLERFLATIGWVYSEHIEQAVAAYLRLGASLADLTITYTNDATVNGQRAIVRYRDSLETEIMLAIDIKATRVATSSRVLP